MANVLQKPDESFEDFGKRVKEKFRILNESYKSISEVDAEVAVLFKANEKLAITIFQQNMRSDTVKVLVPAANKSSLDDNI